MRALLIDPSLFTAPYDAALSQGLRAAGVTPRWAVRGLRSGEEAELPPEDIALTTYRLTDGPRRRQGRIAKIAKGLDHAIDLRRIERAAREVDVVHVQWALLPLLDAAAMRRIRRHRPVILTVHDTTPLNGAGANPLQVRGFDSLFGAADRLIVHTEGARDALVGRGVAAERIDIIAHGPLALRRTPQPEAKAAGRWRIVQFGRIQGYKGVDIVIEALGRLRADDRARLEVIVAGEPFIDLAPLAARAGALGLAAPTFTIRPGRLDDQAMADLLASADSFVFPYHAIEASGVLFLVAGLRRWIVASALGAFVDAIGGAAGQGALVPPGDPQALAAALVDAIGRVPGADGHDWAPPWADIGARTRAVYETALAAHGSCGSAA